MIEDTASLLRRIEMLEARVGLLETKKSRTKRVKSTAGDINLDDNADLFTTASVQPTTATQTRQDNEEVSFGMLEAEPPVFGYLD